MTARKRVLAAYGGRCAWCQSTAHLEIDHIHNDGAAHRHAIMMKLEYWLCRQHATTGHWPTGMQLLCKKCHDEKSGRLPSMPARQGASQVNISLPDSMAAQLALLANAPEYGSKSRVLEAALRLLVEGSATESALAGVHQHVSEISDKVTEALRSIEIALSRVTNALHQSEQRMAGLMAQSDRQQRQYQALLSAYDQLKNRLPEPNGKSGFLSRIGL